MVMFQKQGDPPFNAVVSWEGGYVRTNAAGVLETKNTGLIAYLDGNDKWKRIKESKKQAATPPPPPEVPDTEDESEPEPEEKVWDKPYPQGKPLVRWTAKQLNAYGKSIGVKFKKSDKTKTDLLNRIQDKLGTKN